MAKSRKFDPKYLIVAPTEDKLFHRRHILLNVVVILSFSRWTSSWLSSPLLAVSLIVARWLDFHSEIPFFCCKHCCILLDIAGWTGLWIQSPLHYSRYFSTYFTPVFIEKLYCLKQTLKFPWKVSCGHQWNSLHLNIVLTCSATDVGQYYVGDWTTKISHIGFWTLKECSS